MMTMKKKKEEEEKSPVSILLADLQRKQAQNSGSLKKYMRCPTLEYVCKRSVRKKVRVICWQTGQRDLGPKSQS
jgi:hypothetical protein